LRLIVCATGLPLTLAFLFWDALFADGPAQFGKGQLAAVTVTSLGTALGILFPARILLLGKKFLESGALGLSAPRWIGFLGLVALALILPLFLSRDQFLESTSWIMGCFLAAACLILPGRSGWALLFVAIAAVAMAGAINTIKIDLTGMPLTMLDVRIAVADPAGLWKAMGFPGWTFHTTLAILLLLASGLVVLFLRSLARIQWRRGFRRRSALVASHLALILVIGLLATSHLNEAHAKVRNWKPLWMPGGLSQLATRMGTFPFLVYSYRLEKRFGGDFFLLDTGDAVPPPPDRIQEVVDSYFQFGNAGGTSTRLLPNIVVVLAESTFDPGLAFHLDGKFRSSLFEPGTDSTTVAPLFVNAVGGGTWITEFESLLGLDARLFGFSGYYTHASLAPFVANSLAIHLRARGYRTHTFLPHGGEFYRYRAAYEDYGFETILDSLDRGGNDDWDVSDVEIARSFIDSMTAQPDSPFFANVLLLENHGPHECNASEDPGFPVRFAATGDFEANCILNEYLRRLRSTEQAFSLISEYLRNLEDRTGRPFVLLVYGDHQPFSFTGETLGQVELGKLRRSQSRNETFLHLVSTTGNRLKCCEKTVPASLLPTLLSGLAATGPEDVYLPINLWLYEHCGHDPVLNQSLITLTQAQGPFAGRDSSDTTGLTGRSRDCDIAYRQALSEYRRSGLLKLENGFSGKNHGD